MSEFDEAVVIPAPELELDVSPVEGYADFWAITLDGKPLQFPFGNGWRPVWFDVSDLRQLVARATAALPAEARAAVVDEGRE